MSGNYSPADEKKSATPSVLKNRKKSFLLVEIILALTAIVLAIVNLVNWNTDLPFLSSLVILLVGAVLVLRGIESRLNNENHYKVTFWLGLLICITAIITLVKDLWF